MSLQVNYIGKDIENVKGVEEEGEDSPYLSLDNIKYFKPMFSFLNPKDRDILYLIFLSKKKQKEVQDIMQRGQPSLCYDIKQIRKRLKCISYLQSVYDIFTKFVTEDSKQIIESDLKPAFTDQERGIMTLMFYSTSYIITAETLKMSQVKISSTFDKCIDKLRKHKLWELYEICYTIRDNLNIVKRTYRRNGVILDEAINY